MNIALTSEQDNLRNSCLGELRREIAEGVAAFEKGDFAPVDFSAMKNDLRDKMSSSVRSKSTFMQRHSDGASSD